MEMVGFEYSGAQPPLDRGYVALSALNVVLGPNDVGKSSLLGLLRSALAPWDGQRREEVTLYLRLAPDERDVLIAHAAGELLRSDFLFPEREFGSTHSHLWDADLLEGLPQIPLQNASLTLLEHLRTIAPEPAEAWARLLEELGGSDLFALRLRRSTRVPTSVMGDVGGRVHSRWEVTWCLPPYEQLDKHLRTLLSETAQLASRGGPQARDPDAPTWIAPVGMLDLPITPVAISVPRDFQAIRQQAEASVRELVTHLTYAVTERVVMAGESYGLELTREAPSQLLLERIAPTTVKVRRDALLACGFLSNAVTQHLTRFIHERYEIAITLLPIGEWSPDRALKIAVVDRATGSEFPPDDIAQGHQLWLQLALQEAISDTDRLRLTLERQLELDVTGLHHVYWDYVGADELGIPPSDYAVPDGDDILRAGDRTAYLQLVDQFRAGTLAPEPVSFGQLATAMAAKMELWGHGLGTPGVDLLQASRTRLYFIDEPEQHLHPRLQRDAASWLADTTRVAGVQAMIATHAVPFFNLGADANLIYVERPPGESTVVRTIDAASLNSLSAEAKQLGLTRGELLAAKTVFLYVEGRAEEAVLGELFSAELSAIGVCVIPMHTASRATGIAEAEALMQFSSAKVAVWLDNLSGDVIRGLKAIAGFDVLMHEFKDILGKNRPAFTSEERYAAELTTAARRNRRDIEIMPHPARDVFDLLDEASIQELCPDFPGHDVARAQAPTGSGWKEFYAQKFGVQADEATMRAIAAAMRDSNRGSPALTALIEACERLALDVR